MLKRVLTVSAGIGVMLAASFVMGAFGTPQTSSPCDCCKVCVCEDCVCAALGCECDRGGDCFCSDACHEVCCTN